MTLPAEQRHHPSPERTPYEMIGGEATVRQLVRRFYEIMDTLPEAYGIRKLHPESLAGSEQKLYKYLTGWLGGPQLYVEEYGHPMLRARHLPFAIARDEAVQWMLCMRQAMAETIADEGLRNWLDDTLTQLANHMRNREN